MCAHACVCACGCVLLPVRVSDSLTLSFDSNVLWPGKCLGFGFPGLRAMANELLLLFHSPSPSPKASLDPGMLCWGWQHFLSHDQKEQLCLLLWLCSLWPLFKVYVTPQSWQGHDMVCSSKDVRTTHTSAVPHARSLLPRQLGNKHTRVHKQMHQHDHAPSLSPPQLYTHTNRQDARKSTLTVHRDLHAQAQQRVNLQTRQDYS